MNKIYTINEDEMNRIIKMVEAINSATKDMFDRGFPKEYKDFYIEKLDTINVCNFTIGKFIGIYE